VRIQIVLPGVTAAGFWDTTGMPLKQIPGEIVMPATAMADTALAGLDQGEFVTVPSLPDAADWRAYEAAGQKLAPNLSLNVPAARYGTTALRRQQHRAIGNGVDAAT
jgi:uncharacterized protein